MLCVLVAPLLMQPVLTSKGNIKRLAALIEQEPVTQTVVRILIFGIKGEIS